MQRNELDLDAAWQCSTSACYLSIGL